MPTPKKGPRLGGSPAHQRLIVANLATELFEHGRITTTEAKARFLRPVAEKLITKAKKAHLGENALHNRREVLKTIRDKSVVHTLFTEIAPTLRRASGWLHPDHQDRPPQGRQRPHGGHRAGDRGLQAEGSRPPRRPTPAKKAASRRAGGGARAEETADEATDPVEAAAEAAGIATFTEVPEADEEVFEETEGGVAGKYDGSHVPLEDAAEAPEGFPIKATRTPMKYHTPDGSGSRRPSRRSGIDTEESAQAAGFPGGE